MGDVVVCGGWFFCFFGDLLYGGGDFVGCYGLFVGIVGDFGYGLGGVCYVEYDFVESFGCFFGNIVVLGDVLGWFGD